MTRQRDQERLLAGESDERLIARFHRGDSDAFELLYQRHRGPLYRYLLHSLRNMAEAEELYQELWSRLIGATPSFDEATPGAVRAYLFRIARNLLIDRSRRASLSLVELDESPEVASGAPLPEEQLHFEDCGARLIDGIARLPDEQREAFLLKEESGMTLEAIAELAGVGRETIKSRLRYALQRLRQTLEDCL